MNFIESILSRLEQLWPFVRVKTYQRGVRFRGGKAPVELQPGVHFAIWWFDEVLIVDVTSQPINLPTQSITTKDGVPVSFSANVIYRVTDPVTMLTAVSDFDDSVTAIAMNHLAKRVREQSMDELRTGQDALEKSLEGTLHTRVKKWGVEIEAVGLTDLVQARAYRLLGDPVVDL
jgi:regulator of protease activity HflC (stomatin/prohibitin superfamily)